LPRVAGAPDAGVLGTDPADPGARAARLRGVLVQLAPGQGDDGDGVTVVVQAGTLARQPAHDPHLVAGALLEEEPPPLIAIVPHQLPPLALPRRHRAGEVDEPGEGGRAVAGAVRGEVRVAGGVQVAVEYGRPGGARGHRRGSSGGSSVGCQAARSRGMRLRPVASRLWGGSDQAYPVGLRALLALRDLELDPLVVFQTPVAVGLDRREVDEDVRPAAVGGDEAEALLRVEPLDRALCHVPLLWVIEKTPTRRGRRSCTALSRRPGQTRSSKTPTSRHMGVET